MGIEIYCDQTADQQKPSARAISEAFVGSKPSSESRGRNQEGTPKKGKEEEYRCRPSPSSCPQLVWSSLMVKRRSTNALHWPVWLLLYTPPLIQTYLLLIYSPSLSHSLTNTDHYYDFGFHFISARTFCFTLYCNVITIHCSASVSVN